MPHVVNIDVELMVKLLLQSLSLLEASVLVLLFRQVSHCLPRIVAYFRS